MYKKTTEQKLAPQMSPRISFSNDFVETSQSNSNGYRDAPVSSDFEFSKSNYSMMSADELFFKGRLLPLKESCSNSSQKTTTLRDELQNNEDNNNNSWKPPKNPTRWRGFLGFRKAHIGSKKSDKCERNVDKSNNSQDFAD